MATAWQMHCIVDGGIAHCIEADDEGCTVATRWVLMATLWAHRTGDGNRSGPTHCIRWHWHRRLGRRRAGQLGLPKSFNCFPALHQALAWAGLQSPGCGGGNFPPAAAITASTITEPACIRPSLGRGAPYEWGVSVLSELCSWRYRSKPPHSTRVPGSE